MTVLRICFVGDSLTTGTGDAEFLGWPGRLCAAEGKRGHDLSCYNLGIRADTSLHISARWRAECAARLPDIHPGRLVFAFGNNDTAIEEGARDPRGPPAPRVAPATSLATARAILAEAKAWKPVLFIGPWPVEETKQPVNPMGPLTYRFANARVAELSAAYAALAHELGIPYLDLYGTLAEDERWQAASRAGDGVHPPAKGYRLVAAKVEAWTAWRAWLD